MIHQVYDVVIIGAGPSGLSCAIECQRAGLKTVILEKGCLVNSIYHFPANMIFFTTSDLLEIGEIPFSTTNVKPTRDEGLNYYKRVAQFYKLDIKTGHPVSGVARSNDSFLIRGEFQQKPFAMESKFVVIATGYFDQPNVLNIPGENLPKVSHYYSDPHPFFDKDVVIIGGKNSACISALELHRYGARVILIHRRDEIKESVKYWVLPDFLNRVKEGGIKLHTNSFVTEIQENSVTIMNSETHQSVTIPNDFVFALTGYRPNADFLKSCGIHAAADTLIPEHDPETLETNIKGLYIAGSVSAGIFTNKLFIENGRFHGRVIAENIAKS